MPVNAEYVKMTTYPIDPRGQLISSRRDSALYWGNPSISSSASCDLALNTTDFAILLVGAVIVNSLESSANGQNGVKIWPELARFRFYKWPTKWPAFCPLFCPKMVQFGARNCLENVLRHKKNKYPY